MFSRPKRSGVPNQPEDVDHYGDEHKDGKDHVADLDARVFLHEVPGQIRSG